jgi:hypothetical protein
VIFYNNGDTLKQASTNDTLIKHFGDVLNGNAESLPACKIIGRVDFYRNDELVETVDITETDKECSHLVVGKNAWRMTYNVGMYLSWLYDDLIKKNE